MTTLSEEKILRISPGKIKPQWERANSILSALNCKPILPKEIDIFVRHYKDKETKKGDRYNPIYQINVKNKKIIIYYFDMGIRAYLEKEIPTLNRGKIPVSFIYYNDPFRFVQMPLTGKIQEIFYMLLSAGISLSIERYIPDCQKKEIMHGWPPMEKEVLLPLLQEDIHDVLTLSYSYHTYSLYVLWYQKNMGANNLLAFFIRKKMDEKASLCGCYHKLTPKTLRELRWITFFSNL